MNQINQILLRSFAGIIALFALVSYCQPRLFQPNREGKIYVSPTGSDWNSGASKRSPLRQIQSAVDVAQPGDRIILLPGQYSERVHLRTSGTKDKPISFEAEKDGTVIIDWKNDQLLSKRSDWQSERDGIYSIQTPYAIYRMSHRGETLFRLSWGSVDDLRKLIKKPNAFSAFIYLNNRCYVWLSGGRDPSSEEITTHKPVPNPREWGEFKSSNLWVEADHIIIRGLNLEYGIGSSIRIWNGENITIEQCAFSGATYGVWASQGLKPSRNLMLNHCLYHNYPQYEWAVDWLSWKQIYAYYSSSSLVCAIDDGTIITGCVAVHCGDGLRLSSKDEPNVKVQLSKNWIGNCTDDAIEFDGPACNMIVSENVIADAHNNLGFSPVSKGPVLVENNLFLNPVPHQVGSLFKLLSPHKETIIQNIVVKNNFFWGNWLSWWNETPVKNLVVQQNTFFIKRQIEQPWPPGVIDKENSYTFIKKSDDFTTVDSETRQILHDLTTSERNSYFQKLLDKQINNKPGPLWWKFDQHLATHRLNDLQEGLHPKP